MKNNMIKIIVVVIIVAGVAFYGGMKYQESRRSALRGQLGVGAGGRFGGQFQGGTTQTGFRPVNGEVISIDDKSITVRLEDGSSKIILLTDKTEINKAEKAAKTDLKTEEQVAIFGSENSDGSVTAQNIQLNPQFGRMRIP